MKLRYSFIGLLVGLVCVVLLVTLLGTILGKKEMRLSELITLFKLPIASEQLLDRLVENSHDGSTSIALIFDYDESIEKPTIFDLDEYKNYLIYDELIKIIELSNLDKSDVTVQTYFVGYRNRFGINSSLQVYVIIGSINNANVMVIYSVLPERIKIVD